MKKVLVLLLFLLVLGSVNAECDSGLEEVGGFCVNALNSSAFVVGGYFR